MRLFSLFPYLIAALVALVPRAMYAVDSVGLSNPLQSVSLEQLLYAIIAMIQVIGIPIAVLFLIYTGFLFVIARGNPTALEEAKQALVYGIIGGTILLGAYAITTIITNFVTTF